MMKIILVSFLLMFSACSNLPKCGNPDGAKTILSGKNKCEVRIRQVTIGADLKIPKSLKGTGLSQFILEWVEPGMVDGRIHLGHFVLVQRTSREEFK